MIKEILPGIWRIVLPLPEIFLQHVNVHVLRDGDGFILVDCGFGADDGWPVLQQAMVEIGASVADVHTVVVTHGHHDHFGLAGQFRETSGARVWLHQEDRDYMRFRYLERDAPKLVERWLASYGVPVGEARELAAPPGPRREAMAEVLPDRLLNGGEELRAGSYRMQVQWTPGHTPGHVCLREPDQHILLCGDHVLPKASPNVSMQPNSPRNPLPGYLESLRGLTRARTDLALPGHGDPMPDIAERARGLLKHQLDRRDVILGLMNSLPQTPYELASRIWATSRPISWDGFRGYVRRNAVGTTIAHAELLAAEGRLQRHEAETITFSRR